MRVAAEETTSGLPTFLIIGAMKAGTTSLYHYVRQHEQVYMPKVKELDFFVEEMNWPRGISWYQQQFAGAPKSALARGEASTAYTKFPKYAGVPERIAAVVPGVRLIYVVRNPVTRTRSHYQHRVALGAETNPPEVAVLGNSIYTDYSRYSLQIDQYLDYFPPGQLLVITSESLQHDRRSTMSKVYEFLQVCPDFVAPGLNREYYRTADRRSYPPVVWAARQLVKRRVPQAKRVKEMVDFAKSWRMLAGPEPTPSPGTSPRSAKQEGCFPVALEEELAGLFRDEVARLRSHLGSDFDGWGLG